MSFKECARLGVVLLTCVLAACGGGGGDSGPNVRPALETVSQDNVPSGTRLDFRDRNYFPAAVGDNWTFDRQQSGVSTGQTVTRKVSAGAGSDLLISETSNSETDSSTYRRTAEGLVLIDPLGVAGVPATAVRTLANLLEYAEPFYAVGGTRSVLRQGDWGADEDRDGVNESFRFEFSQVFVGLETLTVSGTTVTSVAHFRNVITLTLQYSDWKQPTASVSATEETWWAPGMGLVRTSRSVVNSNGATSTSYVLALTGGSVAGKPLLGSPANGALQKIALVHNALVYDGVRNRYYASVPGSVTGNGNRIASIDGSTGSVSYSAAAVGSEPFALALSADRSALFVGLNGSGDVLKLRLPDMVELWRARLPQPAFYGQLFAERIAVSPIDSDVVAVSTFRTGVSPRHGGVALIRGGVVQPTMTQDHTGSNLIAFDANGQYVYGFNNETTEFGLRRIAVLATGLRQEQVVTAVGGNFGARALDWSTNGLVLDRAVYRSPDLALLGQVNTSGGGCRPAATANRLVCNASAASSSQSSALAVVDATSFVILSTPVFQPATGSDQLTEIVPGAAGQAALRMNATYYNSSSNAVWLYNSSALP